MKTPEEWMQEAEPGLPLAPALTPVIIRAIQRDSLFYASNQIHQMSRGTTSEDRAIAIDEARDLLEELAAEV